MNLEPELAVGHGKKAPCSCSFCKINKVNKQSVRRFIFGRPEYNLQRYIRRIESSLVVVAEKPKPKPKRKGNHWKAELQKELPDVAELDKRLETITC